MGSSRLIAKGIAWTTIVNIVNGIYGFISVPILLAYFGKSDYGLIGLAMSVNVYLRLMDLGFNSTNVRYFSSWLAKRDYTSVIGLFRTSLSFYGTLGILNATILLVVSFFSDKFFNVTIEQNEIVKHLFYILSISAFISWYTSCFDQLIKANECVGWTQKITLLPKFIQIIILVMTVTIGFSIEWYYALTAFSMFIIIPIMIRKIKRLCPYISFIPSFDKKIFKEVLPYSLNIFSFGIFQFSIMNLRPVFLGMESSPDSISDYRILDGIIKVVLMFGGTFIGVLLPSVSKAIANNDKEAYYRVAYQGTKFISIVVCFCCFGMMSITPELLTVYVGKEYLYLVFWLDLWLILTLSNHNQAMSSIILAGSDIRALTYISIFSSVLGLITCWYTIPLFDVGGTVISYLVYSISQMCFYYFYYWPNVMKINSSKVFFTSFLPYVLSGGIICFGLRVLDSGNLNDWVAIFIKGTFFCVAFIALVFFILQKEDKQFVKRLVNIP